MAPVSVDTRYQFTTLKPGLNFSLSGKDKVTQCARTTYLVVPVGVMDHPALPQYHSSLALRLFDGLNDSH